MRITEGFKRTYNFQDGTNLKFHIPNSIHTVCGYCMDRLMTHMLLEVWVFSGGVLLVGKIFLKVLREIMLKSGRNIKMSQLCINYDV